MSYLYIITRGSSRNILEVHWSFAANLVHTVEPCICLKLLGYAHQPHHAPSPPPLHPFHTSSPPHPLPLPTPTTPRPTPHHTHSHPHHTHSPPHGSMPELYQSWHKYVFRERMGSKKSSSPGERYLYLRIHRRDHIR